MLNFILRQFLELKENKSRELGNPKKFLIVRQHNQFGDMLANVSIFRAIKETYTDSEITLIVSPQNYYAITKNKFIDRYFNFDKKQLLNSQYRAELWSLLKEHYDVAVIPSTVSISSTSLILARLANADIRIGPASLNGQPNKYSYLVDRRITLNWRRYPDAHVSDFGLEIVRPFGISTKDFSSTVSFDETDVNSALNFLSENDITSKSGVIGLHVGAGKPQNRWSAIKFAELIDQLHQQYKCSVILTGSSSDIEEIEYVNKHTKVKTVQFLNKTIPELAALISRVNLFITNDTGVMHVAGTTGTPQISVFGPTNPFNWAPVGPNKYFIRKSDLIDDISVEEVYNLAKMILGNVE